MWKQVLFLCSLLFLTLSAHGQLEINIYDAKGKLTNEFINELCIAAREHTGNEDAGPSKLEELINYAAGAIYNEKDQPLLSYKWHTKYGVQCYCEGTTKFKKGDIIRQVVQSNYREFANIIGPNNRLSLNLELIDPNDSLTVLEYVNQERKRLEKEHNDKRFEFQQDEEWRNIMFFYFLFSEFSIN